MKKTAVGILLAALVSIANCATLTPIQLLSTAGASNGWVVTNISGTPTWAAIGSSATVTVPEGGTGATSLTGLALGNGTSPLSAYGGTSCTNQFPRSLNASGVAACASVANADLSNSSITFGATSAPLGSTVSNIDGVVIGVSIPSSGSFTTLAASGNGVFSGTGSLQLPAGTTGQEPTGVAGMTRYNTTTGRFEFYGTAWRNHVRLDGDTMTGTLVAPGVTGATTSAALDSFVIGGVIPLAVTGTNVSATTQHLSPAGTVSVPSYSFTSDASTGWYRAGASDVRLTLSGSDNLRLNGGAIIASGGSFGWGSSGVSSPDTLLSRDGAGIISERNGTNAQVYRVSNTYTNTSNYERGVMDWQTTANVLTLGAQASGTGTLRPVNLVGASVQNNGKLLYSNTAPTISSGFGTSPSVASNNGTATYRVNVGTGGTASTGVIGLPTSSNGWNCSVQEFAPSATALLSVTVVSASDASSVTVTNDLLSTGAATAWQASQVLMFNCAAY